MRAIAFGCVTALLVAFVGCRRDPAPERPMGDAEATVAVAASLDASPRGTFAIDTARGDASDDEAERRTLIARRKEQVESPCAVSSAFKRQRPIRATGPALDVDFDLPANTAAPTAKRFSAAVIADIHDAVLEFFDDDPSEPSKACASCVLTYARNRFYSWRCMVEHLPVGAYLDYAIVGLDIDDADERARPIHVRDVCPGTRHAALARRALRLLAEAGHADVAREIGSSLDLSSVSVFRGEQDVVLSFTRSLPHVWKGLGEVKLTLENVERLCGSSKLVGGL